MCVLPFYQSYEFNDPGVLYFQKIIDEANEGFGLGFLADFYPWAQYIPTAGRKWLHDITDRFLMFIKTETTAVKEVYDSGKFAYTYIIN